MLERLAGGWRIHVVFVACYAVGRFAALVFETDDWGFAAWFPPAGVLLAYLFVAGPKWAPFAVLVRLLVVEIPDLGGSLTEQIGRSVGITASYALAALVLRRVRLDHARLREFGWFASIGVVLAPLGAAGTIVAVELAGGAELSDLTTAARVLWIGDAIAVATIVPPVLIALGIAAGRRRPVRWPVRGVERLEALLTAMAVVLAPAVVLSLSTPNRITPLIVLAVIPVIWVAVRQDVLVAAIGVLVLETVVAVVAVRQLGASAELVELQTVMLAAALAALFTGASLHGRSEHMADLLDAAESTRLQAERLSIALESMTDAFCILDPDWRLTHVNGRADAVLAGPGNTATGSVLWDLLPELIGTELETAMRATMEGGGAMALEQFRSPVDQRWYEVRLAPSSQGLVVLFHDITERRAMDELGVRAQRLESIGTLAGGIAHDLNNVLTPIVLSVELLLDDDPDPDHREILTTIAESARRGADLVQQVLTFARGATGERELVDVADVADAVRRLASDTVPGAPWLQCEIEAGRYMVSGDRTQLVQVVLNLVLNARDAVQAAGRGTVEVTVAHRRDEASEEPGDGPDEQVVIRVADTGTGMSPAVFDRVFEPFFTTKMVDRGTGLGLSTSLAIARSHGGTITAESHPGEGSVFEVCLPGAGVETPSVTPRPRAAPPTDLPRAVLVTDDEPAVLRSVTAVLEAAGYRVLTATDGREALDVFARHLDDIDVVITDMMMPDVDGAGLAAEIAALRPGTPVIAMSGVSGSIDAATAASVVAYLQKPYSADDLLGAVSDAASSAPPDPGGAATGGAATGDGT